MDKGPTVQYDDPPPGLSAEQIMHWREVRDALFRLHALGKKLPPVDAVSFVREGNAASFPDT